MEGGRGGRGNREQNIREKTATERGRCEEEYDGGGVSVWGAPVESCSAVALLLTASFGKWEILSAALAGDH